MNRFLKRYWIIITIFLLVGGGVGIWALFKKQPDIKKISIADKVILFADIADTEYERHQGLSHRESLEEDKGMLFVFSTPGNYGFHMPDMNFPIDIFWVNDEKRIVTIKYSASPDDYPEVYYPTEPSRYVLETVAGLAQQYDIQIGDSISW